jgi:hypothetical protein
MVLSRCQYLAIIRVKDGGHYFVVRDGGPYVVIRMAKHNPLATPMILPFIHPNAHAHNNVYVTPLLMSIILVV